MLDRNPEGAVVRGKWADLDFLKDVSDLNPTAQGHPVRRLSRPWLEFPRGAKARPRGNLLDATATSSRTTIPTSSTRPCTCHQFTSTSACTASTATSRRTTTATATSTGRSRARSKSSARTVTARRRTTRTCSTSGPAAPPGGTDLRLLRNADGQQSLRVARRRADPALGAGSGPRMGAEPGEGHRQSRACRVQRKGRARQADEQRRPPTELGHGRRAGESRPQG